MGPKVRWLLAAASSAALALGAGTRVRGKVVDDNQAAVAGARVWIGAQSALSDPTGAFHLELDSPGDCHINAQKEGFFLLRDRAITLMPGDNVVTLVLNHQRGLHDSINVSYSPPAVNPEEIRAVRRLVSTELIGIPFPNTSDLRNALPALPGIVQDSRGNLHMQGSSADQTYWTLDGFNITDPLTGKLDTRLSIEGIRTVEVETSRYSAETGKGSGGAIHIRTGMGDDRWRPSGTNFIPGIENHKGLVFSDWKPRASLSGPIIRGRVWFFDSMDTQYNKHIVDELPEGEDRSPSWRSSNLLRSQVNLAPSNILTASWLLNYWNAPRNGLTSLDPIETTVDRRSRQQFFSLKDQVYLGRGALIEFGYAATRGFGREIPQGSETYVITPEGRHGNYFIDSERQSGRDQWLANAIFPSFSVRGSHQLQAGLDLNRLTYYQRSDRHPYEFYRLNGTLSRRQDFGGNNEVRRHNFETAAFLEDRWKPLSRLLVDFGVRVDWDQILREPGVSPRLGFSLAVPGLENTKIAGGFGLFRDGTNLRVFSRHLDQYSLSRHYGPDGATLLYGPSVSIFRVEDHDLYSPVYHNWSLGLEQILPGAVYARFEYLWKRGRHGLTFVNSVQPASPFAWDLAQEYGATSIESLWVLRNERRDVYDSFEMTFRKTFHRQHQFLISYTRSRALSNAVIDASIDDPMLVTDNAGRLPWDTPNRFVSWGLFPITEKNGIAYLVEWRDGFPFNVIDENGLLSGRLNERRFPVYFSLNLHWERKFTVGRHRWALRGGFNNITNRQNPTVVNNVAGAASFLRYSGGQHRAFVMRIRWLGRRTP